MLTVYKPTCYIIFNKLTKGVMKMLKTNTNIKIIEIYEELEKGRSIDLEFNEAKFTFTKEQPEPMVHARLIVQY